MEEIIDAVPNNTRRKRGFCVFCGLLSFLVSAGVAAYSFYLTSLGVWWFAPLAILFTMGLLYPDSL